MVPNIYTEQSVNLHRQELLVEAQHQQMLASQRRPLSNLMRRNAGRLGGFLMELGTSLKEFEQQGKQVFYDL